MLVLLTSPIIDNRAKLLRHNLSTQALKNFIFDSSGDNNHQTNCSDSVQYTRSNNSSGRDDQWQNAQQAMSSTSCLPKDLNMKGKKRNQIETKKGLFIFEEWDLWQVRNSAGRSGDDTLLQNSQIQ